MSPFEAEQDLAADAKRRDLPESEQSIMQKRVKTVHRLQSRRGVGRQDDWMKWIFVVPPLVVFAGLVLVPIGILAYLSLVRWEWVGPMQFVGLENYREILSDELFWLSLRHNFQWMVASLIVPPCVGLMLAILLARTHVRGRLFFQVVYFLPQMVASFVVAIIWRWIYYPRTGPLNVALTAVGLGGVARGWLGSTETVLPALFVAHTWVANGFSMLIFLAAIKSIPEALFEAAKIDGAKWSDEIRYVLLPGIRPALATVVTVTAIWSFQIFDLIWITVRGGPAYASMVLAGMIYTETFRYMQVGKGAALAMVLTALVLLLSPVFMVVRRRQ